MSRDWILVRTYQLGQEGYSRLQGPTIDRQVHLRRGTAGSATDSHSMKNSSSHREIQRVPDLSDLPEMEMDFPGTDGARLGAQVCTPKLAPINSYFSFSFVQHIKSCC